MSIGNKKYREELRKIKERTACNEKDAKRLNFDVPVEYFAEEEKG